MTKEDLGKLRGLRKEIAIYRKKAVELKKMGRKTKKLEKKLLELAQRAEDEEEEIMDYIESCDDPNVRLAIFLHYVDGKSWPYTAVVVGGNNTPDSVRKMVERYIAQQP